MNCLLEAPDLPIKRFKTVDSIMVLIPTADIVHVPRSFLHYFASVSVKLTNKTSDVSLLSQ